MSTDIYGMMLDVDGLRPFVERSIGKINIDETAAIHVRTIVDDALMVRSISITRAVHENIVEAAADQILKHVVVERECSIPTGTVFKCEFCIVTKKHLRELIRQGIILTLKDAVAFELGTDRMRAKEEE